MWKPMLESGAVSACRLPERFQSSPEFAALRSGLAAKKVGFLHIPKTAGTAFTEWLRGLYFPNEVYDNIGTWHPDVAQAKLFCGHLHLSTLRDSGRTHIFTILRDPAERLVSLYRFGRSTLSGWPESDPVKSLSFEEWLKCETPETLVHRDFYRRIVLTAEEQGEPSTESRTRLALERYAELAAVGLQEELAPFVTRVAQILSLPTTVELAHLNTAERNSFFVPDYPERPQLSASCRELLTEVTEADYAIYNHFRNGKITLADATAPGADAKEQGISLAGSITARSAPTQVAGPFDLDVVLANRSETPWQSGAMGLHAQWFDAEWKSLPTAASTTPLPSEGIAAPSSREIRLRMHPPDMRGRCHLMVTLATGPTPSTVTAEEFTPLILDVEVVAAGAANPPPPPVIICAHLHDEDVGKVRAAFGLDEARGRKLDFFFWKDTEQMGPEKAFETCWKKFPDRDVILIHPDMSPLPDDTDNGWYDILRDHVAKLPEAGIIGCDLLFPSPSPAGYEGVQCAGGTFENGTVGHINGRTLEYSSELRRPREVAWATFAGVYIRRSTIEACGDIDSNYQWAYVGDVDYCFEARRRGIRVYQVPANLLHAENGTTAPFLEQEEYRAKAASNLEHFHNKWKGSALYGQSHTLPLEHKPALLLVAGMHRSGTSLATRLLRCLGASTTERLVDAHPDNPKGFFEDRDIFEFHETVLLPALGTSWHSVCQPAWQGLSPDRTNDLSRLAKGILQRNYHRDAHLWAIKDPRLSLALPLWRTLFPQVFGEVQVILPVRHPGDVAVSLAARNGLGADHAHQLYTHYWLSALANLQNYRCALIDFGTLAGSPREALRLVAERLGRTLPPGAGQEFALFEQEYYDRALVRSSLSGNGTAPTAATEAANALYAALSAAGTLAEVRLPPEILSMLGPYTASCNSADFPKF